MAKRTRRRQQRRLPISSRNMAIIIMSCVAIGIFFLALLFRVREIAAPERFFGALGTVCILVSFVGIFMSVRDMLDREQKLISRIMGTLLPVISFILWAGTYLLGFVSL